MNNWTGERMTVIKLREGCDLGSIIIATSHDIISSVYFACVNSLLTYVTFFLAAVDFVFKIQKK